MFVNNNLKLSTNTFLKKSSKIRLPVPVIIQYLLFVAIYILFYGLL